jgi:hypothetical protein
LLTLLIVGASLTGCAATPSPDPWQTVEVPERSAQQPLPQPDRPLPDEIIGEGEDQVWVYDRSGVERLEAYVVTAEGNQQLALEHAGRIDDLQQAVGDLVSAGKGQRRVADLRLEILEEERRHHAWEKLGYYAGMVLVIFGAAAF